MGMPNLEVNKTLSTRDYVVNAPGIFAAIKNLIDKILPYTDDDNESSIGDPLIDIEAIARRLGITDIQRIAPIMPTENGYATFKHAILLGTVVFLNINDNKEKQRFSIAHEIFHFVSRAENDNGLQAVARHGEAWKKEHTGNPELSQKVFIEEVADYFAANLLVPTERFVLLEDKSDDEIALTFGVESKCIKKRREEEIEIELNQMAPKSIFIDAMEATRDETPLSLDELDTILEGHCRHEGQA